MISRAPYSNLSLSRQCFPFFVKKKVLETQRFKWTRITKNVEVILKNVLFSYFFQQQITNYTNFSIQDNVFCYSKTFENNERKLWSKIFKNCSFEKCRAYLLQIWLCELEEVHFLKLFLWNSFLLEVLCQTDNSLL